MGRTAPADRGDDQPVAAAEGQSLVAAFILAAVAGGSFDWKLPPGFPPPVVPSGNPMSSAKVDLGRHLFYDRRLSANGTQACASCHRQELAFSDGRPVAIGSTGQTHRRSAMTLTNVAYNVAQTWADPSIAALEDQALIPMKGLHPVELGLEGNEAQLAERLRADPRYVQMFRAAFPEERDAIDVPHVTKAIACFERTLISGNSPYDQLVYQGREKALSESAWRGLRLFFSDRLACSKCHAGINFSGPVTYEGLPGEVKPTFHNTALYDVDGVGGYPPADTGLESATRNRQDMGRFRAPTLRNIALTAPYMHDGSIPTLEAVLDHYAAGGRAGKHNPRRSPLLRGFRLSAQDKRDLVEFLRSLTDRIFVTDPRLADPEPQRGP